MSDTNLFTNFALPDFLLQSLERSKLQNATPIQQQAIPIALEGHDILASAETGSGKTLAYLLPLITHIEKSAQKSALILTPTRELAVQVQQSLHSILGAIRLKTALLIGGEPMFKQFQALKRMPQFVIGTPGRILDHLNRGSLKLATTEFLVLDETDRMLDMGFTQDLEQIVEKLPKQRQTLMFSATLSPTMIKVSKKYLRDAKHITVGSTTEPCANIKQESIQLSHSQKTKQLLDELSKREGSIIVFVKTKIGTEKLASSLQEQGHFASAIHGDLKQRRRDQVIRAFRSQKSRIMVATDLAARGLDIPHVKHVINYDLPQCPEDYIHRIGRTGRAGVQGFAISFISPDDRTKWRAIDKLINGGQYTDQPQRQGRRPNQAKGRRFQSDGGERRFQSDGRRRSSSEGGRRFSSDGDRRAPSEGGRRFASDGDRRAPSERGRRFSSDGDRRAPSEGGRRFSSDGDRRAPSEGGRRFASDGDRRAPSEGGRRFAKPEGERGYRKRGESTGAAKPSIKRTFVNKNRRSQPSQAT